MKKIAKKLIKFTFYLMKNIYLILPLKFKNKVKQLLKNKYFLKIYLIFKKYSIQDKTNNIIYPKDSAEAAYLMEPDCIINFIKKTLPSYNFDNKSILDFGCGNGTAALGLAELLKNSNITGIDLHDCKSLCMEFIQEHPKIKMFPDNLDLHKVLPDEDIGIDKYDFIYSWSVAEHISQNVIQQVFKNIYKCLKPGGIFLLQTTPLYYSANGHHLFHANITPWQHLILQDDLLLKTVEENCPTKEMYESLLFTYQTLNKITFFELIKLFKSTGFKIINKKILKSKAIIPNNLLKIYRKENLEIEEVVILGKK